jgi:hypothetical protein
MFWAPAGCTWLQHQLLCLMADEGKHPEAMHQLLPIARRFARRVFHWILQIITQSDACGAKVIRPPDPRIVRTQIWPTAAKPHARTTGVTYVFAFTDFIVLLCAGGFEPSDPRITACYKSGHSEIGCAILSTRMYLILLIFWCRKEDYSALRASPLRGRPTGAQLRLRRSCRTGSLSVRGSNRKRRIPGPAQLRHNF